MEAHDESVQAEWTVQQAALKKDLTVVDALDFDYETGLRLVGGVDISFVKGNEVDACASLVVLSYPELSVVYEKYTMVKLTQPYIPGFLAFREVPFLKDLLDELKTTQPSLYPQVVFVDGNGYLHYRGFGLACHLGVLCDCPTVGVGKNLLYVDGLEKKSVVEQFRETCVKGGDFLPLIGNSGEVWGAAFRSTDDTTNPIYISIGHRVSLETACALTKLVSEYKIPEPVRQADLRSRAYLRDNY